MSKSGANTINGTAGGDHLNGGSGADVINGMGGNDRINAGAGNDIIDGGSGNDIVSGDSGDDLATYVLGENVGSTDVYDGGSGIDTLRLSMTLAEWQSPAVQADLARYLTFLAQQTNPQNGQASNANFTFSFGLTVSKFENIQVLVDGVSMDPRDEAVTLVDDVMSAGEESVSAAVNVLANDSVPDLIATLTNTQPAHGSVVLTRTNGAPGSADTASFVYTPSATYWQYLAAGETATDTFTYTVTDSDGDTRTATVTVTITGTNDAPTLTSAVSSGAVVEDGAVVASGEIGFADVDLRDAHTATSTAGAPGYLGTFTTTVTDNGAGDGAGSVTWTFSVDDSAIQYLAVGETLTQSYTVIVDDGQGGTVSQPVTVTITGTNDVPTITTAVASGAVVEDGVVAASGQITFADADLRDGHSVSSTADGAGYLGTFTAEMTDDGAGDGAGSVVWNFSVDNAAIQYLAAGEVRTQTYTVAVADGQGGMVNQTVTVTLTGTNDAPIITTADVQGGVSETQPVTGVPAASTPVMADVETNNTFASAQVINRADMRVAPNTNLADPTDPSVRIQGAISTSADQDVFRIDLQPGETLTLDIDFAGIIPGVGGLDSFVFLYDAAGNLLNFNDDSSTALGGGGSSSTMDSFLQFVATLGGTYYIVVKDFDLQGQSSAGSYALNVSVDSQNLQLTDTGAMTFADVDLRDGHTVSVAAEGAGYLGGLTAVVSNASTNDGAGGVQWTFSVANAAVQFLAAGETRTQSYVVTVNDGQGGTASETVTITITGENDRPTIATAFSSGQVVENAALAASGVIAFDDVDRIDGHSVSSAADGAGYLGSFSASISDPATGAGAGEVTWTFNASDAELQYLAAGQSLLQRYIVTVDDGNGGTTQQLVNITIVGTNDAPTITSAVSTGAVVEDGVTSAAGAIAFADVDLRDGHTVSGTADNAGYLGTFSATVTDDGSSDGAGSVSWNFAVDNAAIQYLAAGQTLTQTYTVVVDDGNGGTVSQPVTVTITGTNDVPTVTSSVSQVFSFSDTNNSTVWDGNSTSFQESGFNFDGFYDYPYNYGGVDNGGMAYTYGSNNWSVGGSDGAISRLDGADFGMRSFSARSNSYSDVTATVNGYRDGVLVATQVLNLSTSHQTFTLGAAFGNVDEVRFDAPQNDYIFLDEIVIGSTGTTVQLTELADGSAGEGTATLTSSGSTAFFDVDLSDAHTATAAAQGSGYVGGLTIDGVDQATNTVHWTFAANDGEIEHLAAGQTMTQTYVITIDDGQGGTVQQTISVVLTGSNDAPTITAEGTDSTGGVTATPIDPAIAAPPAPISFLVEQFTGFQSNDLNTLRNYATNNAANYTATTNVIDYTDDPGGFAGELPGSSPWPAAVASGESGTGGVNDVFFARITSQFSVTTADTYTFRTFNDDGVFLLIDGVLVINDAGYHPEQAREGSIALSPGNHTIELFFFENGGEASLELSVRNSTGQYGLLGGAGGGLGGVSQQITDTGVISFADVDLADGHTVAVAAQGTDYLGSLTAQVSDASTGDGVGEVTWTFNVSNTAVQFLGAGETRTQVYAVSVNDGHGGTVTQNVTVTITGSNLAPVVSGGVFSGATVEDGQVTAAGTVAFTDVNLVDGHTVSSTAGGSNYLGTFTTTVTDNGAGDGAGSVNWNFAVDNAAVQFLAAGQVVTQTYTIAISDGHGGTVSQPVTVTITGTNDAPMANADVATTNEDTPVTFDVRANDTDVDGASRTVTHINGTAIAAGGLVTLADGGRVVLNSSGTLTYTPAVNANGARTFDYTISDGQGGSATSSVNVTVNPVNDRPVAVNDVASATEAGGVQNGTAGQSATGNVLSNDIDIDDSVLVVSAERRGAEGGSGASGTVGSPLSGAYGVLTLNANGSYSYAVNESNAAVQALNTGGTLTDTFTYTTRDAAGLTDTAQLTITINGANDAPTAQNVTLQANQLGNGGFDASPNFSGWTVSTATSGLSSARTSTAVIDRSGGVIAGDSAVAVLQFDGWVPNAYGTGSGPSITSTAFAGQAGDTVRFVYQLSSGGDYANGTGYIRDAVTGAVVQTIFNYQTPFSGSTGVITQDVVLTSSGNYTIDFRVGSYDASGGLYVGARLDLGFAGILRNGVGEDESFTFAASNFTAGATDPDGGTLTVVSVGASANGAVITLNADGSVLYNPAGHLDFLAAGQQLVDTFQYTISDGRGGFSTATASITVIGKDDAPVVSNAAADQSAEAGSLFNYTLAADTFTDPDSALTLTATLADGSPLPSWLVFDAATRTFSGTPQDAQAGHLDIKVTATGGAQSASDVFSLDVSVAGPMGSIALPQSKAKTVGGEVTSPPAEDPVVLPTSVERAGPLDPLVLPGSGDAELKADEVGPEVLPTPEDDAFVLPALADLDDGRLVQPSPADDGLSPLMRPGMADLFISDDPLVIQGPHGPHVLLPDDFIDGRPVYDLWG